jgi:hypothetical protein
MNDQGLYHSGLQESACKMGNDGRMKNIGQVARKMLILFLKEYSIGLP